MSEVLSPLFVAEAFAAAATSAGLGQVVVVAGKVDDNLFLVTMTVRNPVAEGQNDKYLASSRTFEFDDETHLRRIAFERARFFAEAIPTIH